MGVFNALEYQKKSDYCDILVLLLKQLGIKLYAI